MIPSAAGKLFVKLTRQVRVTGKQLRDSVRHFIRGGATLRCVPAVEACGNIQIVEIGASLYRVQDQLEVGVAVLRRQCVADLPRAGSQSVVIVHDTLRFVEVAEAVGVRLQQLRLAPCVELGVTGQELTDGLGVLRPKLLRGPLPRIIAQLLHRERLWVPGIVEEEARGVLHRLQIPNVDDPDPICPVLIGDPHLLPRALDLVGVEPLVTAWAADVIEVVVDAIAASTFRSYGGHAPQVAPVVV